MDIPGEILSFGDDLLELIPQRPPVVMIGALHVCDDERTITSFSVTEECLFTENGYLSEFGLIENMAQTAASRAGYLSRMENLPVPLGFIAGLKDFRLMRRPSLGEVLVTTVRVIDTVMGISIIEGTVSVADETIAACGLKIYIDTGASRP
jgi:predicted hotdog family 3-hydroxylacyl-ACP dehydratase